MPVDQRPSVEKRPEQVDHVQRQGVERLLGIEPGHAYAGAVRRLALLEHHRRRHIAIHQLAILLCYPRACASQRLNEASTDARAAMLTSRRTVAVGVRMWTGLAAPSRMGPP